MATLREAADNGSQQSLGSVAQVAEAGKALALHTATVFVTVPASQIIVLPNDQKAKAIFEALDAADGTAAAGMAVRLDGDLDTTEAEGAELEITYRPWEGEVFTETITPDVSTGIALLPNRSVLLISATTEGGSVNGPKTVVARGATPITTEAALGGDGNSVVFLLADVGAGTSATVVVLGRSSLAARLQDTFNGQ